MGFELNCLIEVLCLNHKVNLGDLKLQNFRFDENNFQWFRFLSLNLGRQGNNLQGRLKFQNSRRLKCSLLGS